MKSLLALAGICCATLTSFAAEAPPTPGAGVKSMFDGKTLAGWEGNLKLWRVEDGCLTGGSLTETVRANDFLATTRDYTNFIVRFQIRLLGSNGFINSGFQIRSQRVPNSSEMRGYQCDYGEPSWYGAIYDEERRNRVVAASDMKALRPALNPNREGWNDYVIRADGVRVTTWINGVMGVDYHEQETGLPNFDWGKLGIQIHGGGKGVVQVKHIQIEELPGTPPGKIFRGAPEPKKGAKAEPVSPEEEHARFTIAPGFEIELVASEDLEAGFGKFITVDWDQHGNLWTMTALEYPVDANESPAVAKELYASKAKDKVLVYDRDPKSPTSYKTTPRVFADGLAIPLGILPYKNGVYVQHGTEIVFLSDTDGDGRADKREVILTGFGVQDSHLFPHQFTRAPGGWLWMAQGAFNYGKVRDQSGNEVQFDQTRMAKFRPDGRGFEITSQGPCNIWGLHMTMEGETWIQEANDFGYPAMPFHEYANYPGCSGAQWKSYAPEFPGTAPHFAMGGTGLSGLAISDKTGWPEAYADVIYIANPITRKIQAIKARRDGPRYALTKLPDFIQSSDEMFRPVALRLGPDGCLYFVDWYNKIISHNEVARNHPDRDKKRGRIWRVRPTDFKPLDVPDFTKASGDELIAKLGGENTTQSHLAWQAISDRGMTELWHQLQALIGNTTAPAAKRIAALWALESMGAYDFGVGGLNMFMSDDNRNLRREAARFLAPGDNTKDALTAHEHLKFVRTDNDPDVTAQIIRTAGTWLSKVGAMNQVADRDRVANLFIGLMLKYANAPLDGPTMKSTQNGKTIKAGEAYDREFERYLIRFFLEREPRAVAAFLKSDEAQRLPAENRLLAALSLEPKTSAALVAQLQPSLTRAPGQEDLLRLAQFPDEPGVGEALKKILQQPATSTAAIESLLKVRTKLDAAKITPLLNDAAKQLLTQNNAASLELGTKLASSFQLASVEPELVRVLEQGWGGYPKLEAKEYLLRPESLAALGALRELKSDRVDLFAKLAEKGGAAEQQAAVAALAASRDPKGPQQLAVLYPVLSVSSRRAALSSLSGTKPGATALVKSVRGGAIAKDELDAATLDKLQAVLGNDPDLAALMADMASFFRPALRLNGEDNAWSDTDLTLDGAFTVETWVKLDAGIDNNDGILGAPGVLDMNFFGSQFRVWVGGLNDVIVAKKKTTADVWTHCAVTRDAAGKFRIYINGELDSDQGKAAPQKFEKLRLGWTAPAKGTAGWLSEFRVWNRARSAEEIRADFDRSFEGETKPAGLAHYFPGAGPWGKLHSGAKVVKTSDFPPLLTPAESKALAEKFTKFHSLADKAGDSAKGQALFATVCQGCHSVGGTGGQIGPVLNGAGALGVEALLRNILTPNAAMEPGYRVFRVELKDGDVLDGIRVSEDKDAIVLRRQNMEDTRIPQSTVKRAAFTKSSIMPEGLLDGLPPEQVSDLFAYLKSLK
jgi:putative membrane-bound dehydrogenase-like protein